MIEKIVLDYLRERLPAAVGMELPADPPGRIAIISKAGSRREDGIWCAMILVKSYGRSLADAAELNQQVISNMLQITELSEICGCYITNDYNATDTASKRYRYQAVFDVYHY